MTEPPARIETLDFIRGIAVMGILIMNIIAFALPQAAYDNPRAAGGATGWDLATWAASFVLIDGKMRGLFSMLFGASLLLVAERAEAKGESAARVHYARMAILLLFGLAHLWLFWWGDILHHYALIGAVALAFRKMAVPQLMASALCAILLQTIAYASIPASISAARQSIAAHPASPPTEALETIAEYRAIFGVPAQAAIDREIGLYRSGYVAIAANRLADTARLPIDLLATVGLETLGFMLMGMAAFRSGLLTGAWPTRRYARWAAICFGIAVPGFGALAWLDIATDFDLVAVVTARLPGGTLLRPVAILGWACLLALIGKHRGWLSARIAAVGRMAFTNYLASTLICTSLFYGYGLGLFAQLSRAALMPIVLGVWIAMLSWSLPWLARYRYGPMEWLWRSGARGSWQAWRRQLSRPTLPVAQSPPGAALPMDWLRAATGSAFRRTTAAG